MAAGRASAQRTSTLRVGSATSSSIQDGLGGAILNFNQYYSITPANLWATNLIAACLGIAFFVVIVIAEKLVVHRAPEHIA
jgi:ABC-type nitrate/sulfonate/bicarbonate transport system permease component